MAEKLSASEIEEFQEAFKIFDIEGKGFVSANNLGKIMRSLGYHPSEIELNEMINDMDLDHNGSIEFNEFLSLMWKKIKDQNLELELIEAVKVFDQDKKGTIKLEEFKRLMTSSGDALSMSEFEQIIKFARIDENNNIDYAKFLKSLTKR